MLRPICSRCDAQNIHSYRFVSLNFHHQTDIPPRLSPTRFYPHLSSRETRTNQSVFSDPAIRHGFVLPHHSLPEYPLPSLLHADEVRLRDGVIFPVQTVAFWFLERLSILPQPQQYRRK